MVYDGTASIVKMIHSFITKDLISLRDVFEYLFCSWLLVLVWMILESQSPETEVSAISWAVSGAATCTPFWSHPRRLQDQVPRAGNSPSGQTLLKQHPLKHYYIHFYYIISFPCLVHFSIHIDPSPALTGWCRASHWLLAHVGSHAVMFVSSLTRPRARTGSQCMSSSLGVSGPPLLRDISSPLIMTAHRDVTRGQRG